MRYDLFPSSPLISTTSSRPTTKLPNFPTYFARDKEVLYFKQVVVLETEFENHPSTSNKEGAMNRMPGPCFSKRERGFVVWGWKGK